LFAPQNEKKKNNNHQKINREMELVEDETLLEDLCSSDHARQTQALIRTLQLLANGRDLSLYFASIVQVR
jgi:hypothetical protein